jgi:hypothetical protein
MKFEVLTAIKMSMPFGLVDRHERFGWKHCLHLQGSETLVSTVGQNMLRRSWITVCGCGTVWTVCWHAFTRNSCEKVSPEEEGKPADHEGAHYDAQCASRLVLRSPACALLPHRGSCNKHIFQPVSHLHIHECHIKVPFTVICFMYRKESPYRWHRVIAL